MSRLSEDKREKIIEMFSEGLDIHTIAKKLHLSEKTVLRVLREEGALEGQEAVELLSDIYEKEEKLNKRIYKTSERAISRVIDRVTFNIVEAIIKSGIATGLEIVDKYKWIAQTYGYEKPEEFIKDAIQFYINYYPVVLYIYERLELLEKIYLATLVSLEQLNRLLAYTYYNTISTVLDGMMKGKIDPKEGKEIIKEVIQFTYDAINRITRRPIQEIIGESKETWDTDSRSTSEINRRNREDNSSGYNSTAYDDISKPTT